LFSPYFKSRLWTDNFETDLRGIVLRLAGWAFCAGADNSGRAGYAAGNRDAAERPQQRFFETGFRKQDRRAVGAVRAVRLRGIFRDEFG